MELKQTSDSFRHLIKVYILLSEKGPVLLTEDADKALEALSCIKSKNIKAYIRDITTPVTRAKQIANNLFVYKNPFKSVSQLIEFRNKVVREWVDIKDDKGVSEEFAWNRLAKKYNIPMPMQEFNQWVLDLNDYLPTVDKKLI